MASPAQILDITRESLSVLMNIEEDLEALYRVAYSMYNQGFLTESVRGEVHRIRDETFILENAMHMLLTTGMRLTMPLALGTMASLLPRPERWPDLPPANMGNPPSVMLSAPSPRRYDVSVGSRTVNGVWAVVAIVAVAAVVAVAVVSVVATQELFEFLRESRRLREETRRYLGQLLDSMARLHLCIDSGNTIEQCFDMVPQPKPPSSDPVGTFPWGLVLGTVAVGGLAWLAFSDRGRQYASRLLPETS